MRVTTKFASFLCLGVAAILFVSPFLLFWFMRSSHEGYMMVIQGPGMFGQMGSGPFQLWFAVGMVLAAGVFGVLAFVLSVVHKRRAESDREWVS